MLRLVVVALPLLLAACRLLELDWPAFLIAGILGAAFAVWQTYGRRRNH